jgi:hypothetical protein
MVNNEKIRSKIRSSAKGLKVGAPMLAIIAFTLLAIIRTTQHTGLKERRHQ